MACCNRCTHGRSVFEQLRFPISRWVSTESSRNFAKERATLAQSYRTLEVTEKDSGAEIREAYIRLARKHHPDSNDSPDTSRFRAVESAYRTIVEHRKVVKPDEPIEEPSDRDLSPHSSKLPQHRHYLANEGFGYGTPSQRQRQYGSFRLDRATESAFNYRLEQAGRHGQFALEAIDRRTAKKNKTSNAVERVVEDLIQESMARGDFEGLKGAGKPLNYSDANPFVDSMTHKLNRILINNGFVPEWAVLSKEIEQMKMELRHKLLSERARYGEEPSEEHHNQWNEFLTEQHSLSDEINKKITKFNFVCPSIQQQLCQVRLALLAEKIFNGSDWREVPPSARYEVAKTNKTKISEEYNPDAHGTSLLDIFSMFKIS